MNEAEQEQMFPTPVGERLRAARDEKGMSLEDVAAKTRIPLRHLDSIEKGEWGNLPAPTYCVGFARAFAGAVGLDPSQVAADVRGEMGQVSYASPTPEYYQEADPSRVPPRNLVITAALIGLLVVGAYAIWRSGAFDGSSDPQSAAVAADPAAPVNAATAAPSPATPAPAATAAGPVVLTASNDVWLRVYEKGGTKLFENTLKTGERYEVPATATAPMILTGRPDAIQVTVGGTQVAPLGPPERTISDVSLLAADLNARAQSPAPAAATPPPAAQ